MVETLSLELGEDSESWRCRPNGLVTLAEALAGDAPEIVRCRMIVARNETGVPLGSVLEVMVMTSLHCPCAVAFAPPAGPLEFAAEVAYPCTAPISVRTSAVASKL